MAENRNIINNYNNNNNNSNNDDHIRQGHNTIIVPLSETTTSITATILNRENSTELGHSESDATHFRLRDIRPLTEYLRCLSCAEIIQANSLLDIYDHFTEKFHAHYYGNCLYCGGKVHRYLVNSTQQFSYYHNCLRWKRGEDR